MTFLTVIVVILFQVDSFNHLIKSFEPKIKTFQLKDQDHSPKNLILQ